METAQGFSLSRKGEVVVHPEYAWAACTLDAWSHPHNCPVEVKHVGAFVKPDDIRARTMAQIHWQMLCAKASQGILSVIFGANEPVQEFINLDLAYASELLARAKAFWHGAETLTPPVELPPVAAPIRFDAMREIQMDGNNLWAEQAAVWLETKTAAKAFENAAKEIKALVPSEVRKPPHTRLPFRVRKTAH